MSTWRDTPFEVTITVERIEKSDLPTWLGRSTSLDNIISDILQDPSEGSVWVYGDAHSRQSTFVRKKIASILNKLVDEKNDTIEIEMEGTSSGYFYPGTRLDPPEDEDERDITKVCLVQDQYDDIEIDEIVLFEDQFNHEIYCAEIDINW